jgi:hypothetical protein
VLATANGANQSVNGEQILEIQVLLNPAQRPVLRREGSCFLR